MKRCLVTGGSGFFGGILKRHLLDTGWSCVNFDIEHDEDSHENLASVKADLRDRAAVDRVFAENKFDAVFHVAALLAHDVKDKKALWDSNVKGTGLLADAAAKTGVQRVVYTSTNCLWGRGMGRPVTEDDPPEPIEIYGRSKLEAEKILLSRQDKFSTAVIRCPTITEAGRLGLLAILFEFIAEGRRVWVVGKGDNRYQFIYAGDLADACVRAAEQGARGIYHVGSDNVKSLREVYQYVIDQAGTGARVASLPRLPTLGAMRVAYWLGVSPLGPYHYKMIAENFTFDTSKIKRDLGWQPTLTNEQMLWRAYEFYKQHGEELRTRSDVSAHRRPASMGAIKILKWIS